MTAPLKRPRAEPTKSAVRTAETLMKLFDELQKDWTAVVVVLRRSR